MSVRVSVCLSVFLQKKNFVQNGSNSQIRWTGISNSSNKIKHLIISRSVKPWFYDGTKWLIGSEWKLLESKTFFEPMATLSVSHLIPRGSITSFLFFYFLIVLVYSSNVQVNNEEIVAKKGSEDNLVCSANSKVLGCSFQSPANHNFNMLRWD